MGKFLEVLFRLVQTGAIKKVDQALKFAKNEFGEITPLIRKQIEKVFKDAKKPKVGKPTKKEGEVVPIKEGIMATDEAGSALKRVQEATEKLKEDPKLQELLRNIGVEDTAPLDSAANVRTALKNMEDRMRVGNNESNIRATLREFLERRLKDGTLNIPDAAERDAIEKVYQGGVDPIDVFRKAYGEDALIAVDDVFEQYGDKIMRESNNYKEIGDKFEKLFKFNRGFYDMAELPVPKKDYGYDPGLMSNKEFADKLRKDLKEKEMLEDFDPTDRTKQATGGRVRAASGGLADILKV
tara:strand:- start:223 stop:1113 length:891 start_codon:yes stop_codon:yes gene_type:complete